MATTIDLRTKLSASDVLRLLSQVPQDASQSKELLTRIGLTLLGRIKTSFIAKARGGSDEAGDSWRPLKKSTIAYSRRHPGVLWPGKKRAPFAPSWMLSEAQRKRWWNLYRKYGGGASQGAGYHAKGVSGGYAARLAWAKIKSEGAKTLIGTYGDTKVEILRDKGLLLNSLSPLAPVSRQPPPTPPPTPPHQIFRFGQSELLVGTNRKWAMTHHRGVPGKIPQRRLWPERWPESWKEEIAEQATYGIIDIVTGLLTGTP